MVNGVPGRLRLANSTPETPSTCDPLSGFIFYFATYSTLTHTAGKQI
jgi:hypothetical protein